MSLSDDDHMPKVGVGSARRIEVFTGTRRRRGWSVEHKAAIVDESYAGTGSVCEVARRHGLTPTQLFSWRREARRKSVTQGDEAASFVPAMVEAESAPDVPPAAERTAKPPAPIMEIETGDAHVWVWCDVDVRLATAVIRALKAGG
jgi:transposase